MKLSPQASKERLLKLQAEERRRKQEEEDMMKRDASRLKQIDDLMNSDIVPLHAQTRDGIRERRPSQCSSRGSRGRKSRPSPGGFTIEKLGSERGEDKDVE